MALPSPRAGVLVQRYRKQLIIIALTLFCVSCEALPVGTTGNTREPPIAVEFVNINTADEAGLTELPGIGPGLAKKVISYRNNFGQFNTAAEIMLVEGIGEKQFLKIRHLIRSE